MNKLHIELNQSPKIVPNKEQPSSLCSSKCSDGCSFLDELSQKEHEENLLNELAHILVQSIIRMHNINEKTTN